MRRYTTVPYCCSLGIYLFVFIKHNSIECEKLNTCNVCVLSTSVMRVTKPRDKKKKKLI